MRIQAITLCLVVTVASAQARAIEVQRSVEVAAAPADVWSVIGPVCSIADWHPAIASCVEEEDGGTLYRTLQIQDGGLLREQILEVDEDGHAFTYSILEGPLPVRGYRSTMSVSPGAEEGHSVIVWQSEFSSVGMPDDEAAAIITGIYDAGLESLADTFAE